MNYKIKITAENQEIVKRIAEEQGMNEIGYNFEGWKENSFYFLSKSKFLPFKDFSNNFTELTTEQFVQMFDKKETEVDKWLRETRAKNLSIKELHNEIDLIMDKGVLMQLQGINNYQKASILFNKWSNEKADNQWNTQGAPFEEEGTKMETEWQPKKGDKVLVWDDDEQKAEERIFLTEIQGSYMPIRVVNVDENKFMEGKIFEVFAYRHMKPLPIKPKEIDYKEKFEKAIKLIEGEIEILNNQIDYAAKDKLYDRASSLEYERCGIAKILNKIKEL